MTNEHPHTQTVPGVAAGYGDLLSECAEGPGVWIHVPARTIVVCVLLRDQPVRYDAHWVGGRVRPCPGATQCALCTSGVGKKTRYVYTVLDTTTKQTGLLEVAPSTALEIRAAVDEAGFARGLAIAFSHEGGVKNGRLRATSRHQILRDCELPDGPDPIHVLKRQWSLPDAERVPSYR